MEWTPKSPDDARLYSYDLSDIYPDTISTATFSVTSGTVALEEVTPDRANRLCDRQRRRGC
jgi:hypothetical protein